MNSQRSRRTYDRIGARNYGMILEERIRRMRDNQAFLRQLQEERGDQQQVEEIEEEGDTLSDRTLYYSMYVQHFGISLVQVKRMEALMVVIYGSAPPITYEQNVASFNSDALTEYNIKRTYYCSSCEGLLSQWRDVCDNEGCELHRLEAELSALRSEPIEIDVDGYGWTIDVTLNKGVADLAAQQGLFGVPRWSSEQGCSKCYITGQRIEGQRVWISGDNENTDLRPPESYVVDGHRGANGIPKATPLMRIIEPCRFPGDALHVCSEGITKNRLRDLFSRQSRFRDLLVNRQGTESIKKCLKEMSCYTYASSLILSLDDLRTCKAAELDEIAFIAFPLSSAAGLIPSPLAAVSLLGYWLCLRIIADSRNLTTVSIEKAQKLASLTQQIWTSMAPEIFTMKCHWFFDHGMKEEITSYGSAYQWSSAPFESHHRRLQIKVDQSTTNSSATIIEKYLLYKKMRNLFENRAVNYPAMTSLRNKVDNKHRTRFPVGISLDDSMYIPKNSRIEPHQLQEFTMRTNQHTPTRGRAPARARLTYAPPRAQLVIASPQTTTPASQASQDVFHDENVPIAVEQVARPGNVNNRPEFNFEEAPRETRREPASLYECVSNGTLDMNKAARLILKQKRDGSFNQSVYDEFVRSEVASRVHYFRNNGILDISDTVLEMRLTGIMNYMMADIQCAKFDRYTRAVELSEKKDTSVRVPGRPALILKNCTRAWKIDGPAPFITADLKQMIVNYHPKEKETPFQLFAGLFRYIIMRATNPPQKIQEYSLRLNGRNGRVDTLLNLPESIQNLLLDFAEDLIGYGHNELRAPQADKTSSFFIKLGSTDEEREQEFDVLQQERVLFRKDSFKGLQLALRDVRSYIYDTTKAQWIPGDRKAKRTRLEVPELENAEPTQE
ncbi:unnamed protein product [Cylicocyclus nassatus]|uniref:Uncharacterized protein n=1 Tax=Cylicocyclus nassatus TaxID=53992 RepID=A0AA36HA04_CYLNA|nr:unnamed protein product [Cylicocyclus nassatus]